MSGSSLSPLFSPLQEDPSSIEDSSLYSLSKLLSCPSTDDTSSTSSSNRLATRSLPPSAHGIMVKRETSVAHSALGTIGTLDRVTKRAFNLQSIESDHHFNHAAQESGLSHKVNKRDTAEQLEKSMECIRSKSWEEIIRIQNEYLNQHSSGPDQKDGSDVFKPLKIGLVIDGLVIPRDPADVIKLFMDQIVSSGGQRNQTPKYQSVDDRLKEQLILSSMLTSPSRASSGQPFKSHDILFGFRPNGAWMSLLSDRAKTVASIEQLTPSTVDPTIKSLIKNSFKYYQEVSTVSIQCISLIFPSFILFSIFARVKFELLGKVMK